MSDPLVKLDPEDWPKLQSAFKKDWPKNVSAFYLLETQRDWIIRGLNYDFTVYCPFGDVQNGMVALNIMKEHYEVVIVSLQTDISTLEEALLQTKIIDWSRDITVPCVSPNIVKFLRNVLLPSRGSSSVKTMDCNCFILEKKSELFDIKIPPEFYIDRLREEHADLLDSTWPLRYPDSRWYFSIIIRSGNAYGIFRKSDDTLVSWTSVNELNEVTHLYTIEEYRRRGLAELIFKYLCNVVLSDGKDVFLHTPKDNFIANSMYGKMGFKNVCTDIWMWVYSRN